MPKTSQACAWKEIVQCASMHSDQLLAMCPNLLSEVVLAHDLPVILPDEAPVEKSLSAERWSAYAHVPRMSETLVDSPQMKPKNLHDKVVAASSHSW